MELRFKPFGDFIKNYTTENSRRRYADSEIQEIDVQRNHILATVRGSKTYRVEVYYTQAKVSSASCTCQYDYGGFCKHVIHVLVYADGLLAAPVERPVLPKAEALPDFVEKQGDTFILAQKSALGLSADALAGIAQPLPKHTNWSNSIELREATLAANLLRGTVLKGGYDSFKVTITQTADALRLSCDCGNKTGKLCVHLHAALRDIDKSRQLQMAFDADRRHRLLAEKAAENGWHNIADLDSFFNIAFSVGRVYIEPKVKVLSYTDRDKLLLRHRLLPTFELPRESKANTKVFVVVGEPDHHGAVTCTLMRAPLARSGDIKSPVDEADVRGRLRQAKSPEETLFFVALIAATDGKARVDDYRDLIKNPLNLDFYVFKPDWQAAKITPKNLVPIRVQQASPEVEIKVKESGDFYMLTCQIKVDGLSMSSKSVELQGGLFIAKKSLCCLNNEAEANVLQFFKKNNHEVYLRRSQFASFKQEFLDKLENAVAVSYSFIKPAPKKVIMERSLDTVSKHYIYLSELDEFVLITPALSYGDVEVPVLSRQTAYTTNPDGSLYSVERNEALEHQFIRNIQAQHPSFDKIPQTDFYYLHKREFLDDGWFIQAFENWRAFGYVILGFNKLKNNRYNEHPIKIRTSVQSGIDWFDIHADVSFGKQKASLRQIQKSVANKTRFVELGDGTQGILPQEWLDKFSHYFRAGEVKDDAIRTHKSNFQLIDQLFDQEVLSQEARMEVEQYKEKLARFHSITAVKVPKKLKATLRDYQKEGLNWLNFLDEFGFGGCLADDMGLGKTVQVIAYFLAQHEKGNKQTNLVVVPTSLLFNWQRELDKFAPHLRYLALYGTKRETDKVKVGDYDIILTTYGTMLSDIGLLKKQAFNVIVLDESQAIKNPDSKRYKAVRLLQGRQRLVLTGTPVENNTFDLFAQLSFALPGLLGNAKRFADDYSTPIDKFQDSKRAQELQRKIHPFVLRRTKKQVAKELPEKTEMVVYCEMGTEQRRVYDAYKVEFQKYLAGLDEDELHSSSLNILQGLMKMRQICNSPALLADDEFYGDQSAKLDELLKQLDKLKDTHKILVFSQFVGMLELVKQRLDQDGVSYAYLTGKTKKREEEVARFQEDDAVRVFLISLKAGGTGLNLTQAEYVFLIDPWWNPAVENQAIDRAYRIGQQNKVVAVRFITPDSIEEKIMELQQRKRQLAEDLVRTDSNMLKQLKKEDLLGLL